MSLKTRLSVIEAAHDEVEIDRYAGFMADRYHVSVVEARHEIKKILARRQFEGRVLSPEELKQAKELRQKVEQWERSRD